MIGDGDPKDVSDQVVEDSLLGTGPWQAICDPFLGPDRVGNLLIKIRVLFPDGLLHPLSDHSGKGLDRDEKARLCGDPLQAVGSESTGRDEEVDVGMVIESPGPGMKDGQEGHSSTEMLVFTAKCGYGLGGYPHEKSIKSLLPLTEKDSESLRDRGGDMEIVAGQHFELSGLKPGLGLGGMAGRATAITAAVEHIHIFTTVFTVPSMTAQGRRTASRDILDGPAMRRQNARVMPMEIFFVETAEDIRDFHLHDRISTQVAHKVVNDGLDSVSSRLGQMKIGLGGAHIGVAQENLDDFHPDVQFQQAGGVTVAKGMRCEGSKPRFLAGAMENRIDRSSADRVSLGTVGKYPGRIAMGGPSPAQPFQELDRQGNQAFLVALADNPDDEPILVDLGRSEMEASLRRSPHPYITAKNAR